MKELEIALKLVIPLEGDVVGYLRQGPKDFMFSGTKADLSLQTRAMINRQRGRHKSTSYKPGVYKLTSSLMVTKFGKVGYVLI